MPVGITDIIIEIVHGIQDKTIIIDIHHPDRPVFAV